MPEFKNPQQDPGMERRLLLVFALTFLVIIGFQPLLRRYLPQPAATPVSTPQPGPQPVPAASQSSAYAGAEASPTPVAAKQAASETETVVENDVYRIVFTNRGGTAKSWVLKKYDDDKGNPLQLVNGVAAEKFGYPLSLWTYDESLRDKLNSALYVGPSAATVNAPGEISFEYSAQDLVVRKKFSFNPSYVMQVETSVLYRGSQVPAFPAWPAGFGDQLTAASYAGGRIEYHNDESTERTLFIFPKVVER
ncbi:MAG: membrane protein insertase YidC, partial [Acidobacteriales bacterium]|nr:membrane protein insertase YidC [Terriglobales bacterium]